VIEQIGPCGPQNNVGHVFIVVINAFQAILIAWLANRRRLADDRELRRNGHGSNGK